MTRPGENDSPRCLLCSCQRLEKPDRRRGSEIRALWRELGTEFPPEALGEIRDDTQIELWRCQECGFEFFDPRLGGNGLFYQCLDSAAYYAPVRPEFERAVQFARRHQLRTVLDVGCGAGGFLDLARNAGLQTSGMELSLSAAATARAKGHRIFDRLLSDLPVTEQPGGFDLITLFQVLEHVADPVGVMKQAAAHLRPGGFISIAVPNKSGLYRFTTWDPAEWPPHHTSRWCLKDFRTLAERSGLRLVESGGDVLLGSSILQHVRLHCRLAAAMGARKNSQPGAWLPAFCWLYRKTGMKYFAPRWGSSVYANLQRT